MTPSWHTPSVTDSDSNVHGAPEPRSRAKRAAIGAARPLVGYFDRRFQDLHDHLDRLPPPDPTARLDEVVALMRQTREDVTGDADTIAELAFTLERFSDLFTARMEEIVETMFTALGPGGASIDAHVVELPFAYAAAETLPAGAEVAAFTAEPGPLPLALASLGMRVTVLAAPSSPACHPNLTVMEEPIERWSGPAHPLHAIFVLSAVAGLGLDRDEPVDDLDRQVVDLFCKWLRPDGLLVLSVPFGEWSVGRHARTYDERHLTELLADWDIRDRRVVERIDDHLWRLVEPGGAQSPTGMVLIRATPRL
jgi:hypothetical protein